MTKMSNPLQQIQNKIFKLEAQLKEQRAMNNEWRVKYHNATQRIETLEMNNVNQSELSHLKLENDKLRVALNKAKREARAADKLKKIERIING